MPTTKLHHLEGAPRPRINKRILLKKYQEDLKNRLALMHHLANDGCGHRDDCHELQKQLRETQKMLLQLIMLVE